MKEIDWSKAPHGATHFRHDDPKSPWRMLKDGVWHAWFGGEWMTVTTAAEHFYIARPAWSGEGLPPVGTVCEVLNNTLDRPEWERCTILFMGKFKAVYESESCHERVADVSESWMISFRPLRTPEQIAAEEREKAIDQMMADYEFTVGSCTHQLFRHQAERLHDAGYRKVTP